MFVWNRRRCAQLETRTADLASLGSERDDGIDRRSPARGQVAGQRRGREKQRADAGQGDRIERPHAEQETGNRDGGKARGGETDHEAGGHRREAANEYRPQHLSAVGAA